MKTETASDRLKAMTKKRHPDHKKFEKEWEFLRAAVEGGPHYADGNLFKHPKEDPTVYSARLDRASDNHFNISQLVTDTYEGYIFQNKPEAEEDLPEEVKAFLLRADKDGRGAIAFAQDVLHWSATYGVIWIGVDKPPYEVPEGGLSKAQEEEAGLAPYAYIVHPTHVLDGKLENGKPVWLLIQEDHREDEDPWTSSGKVVVKWRLWEADKWTLITKVRNVKGQDEYVSDEGPNPLGRVPFIPFYFDETACGFSCKGLISDIAHLDRAIFNKCSLLDEIHYAATFPQLAIPFMGDLIGGDGMISPEGRLILTMGLHSVIPYHTEAGAPAYISPDSSSSATLESNIQKMIGMALALALLDGEVAKDQHSKTNSSGVSKAYVFEKLNRRLSAIASTMERGFMQIFKLVAEWQGVDTKSWPPTLWKFPTNFEVRSLAQEIADTIALLGLDVPSERFKKILFKALVRKAFPTLKEEVLLEIEEEIESFDFEAHANLMMGLEEDGSMPDPERGVNNDEGNRVDPPKSKKKDGK